MIYKTLKKVSNVCQLLDKSKYPATKTINGVTFTNNGDGTITANGTATSRAALLISKEIPVIYGKGLIIGDPQPDYAFINYTFYNNKEQWIADNASFGGNGVIFTGRDDAVSTELYIAIEPGSTANNLIFKPQLFDLTEMYGAGNEPTTVEQFRQDFPDEMYDYKPYCFVKSYKNCLTCTTKNLFDISKVPIISGKLTVKDNSICSYDYPVVTNDTNLLSIFKSLKPDTNYTMSATTLNYLGAATNYIMLIFSNANDDKLIFYNYSAGFNKVTFSLTQEQINNITYVYFYGRNENSGGPTIWRNIQLEEGSTASEYQPYGYIQSRKKSLVCKTKNLFDILDVQIRNTGVLVDNNTVYAGDISIDAATLVVFSKTYAAGTYTITRGNTYGGCTNVRLLLSIRPDSTFAYNNYYKMYFKDFTTVTFTASESFTMGFVLLGSGAGGVYNIQLELGDTATDYVPYGHL